MLESRLYELELRKQNEKNKKIESQKRNRLGKSNSFICNATLPNGQRLKN